MKVELRGQAAQKLVALLEDTGDAELAGLRDHVHTKLAMSEHVAVLTAGELDAVLECLTRELADPRQQVPVRELVTSAVPKLQMMTERTRRKETLDLEQAERAERLKARPTGRQTAALSRIAGVP